MCLIPTHYHRLRPERPKFNIVRGICGQHQRQLSSAPFGVDIPNAELFVLSDGAKLRGRRVARQPPELLRGVASEQRAPFLVQVVTAGRVELEQLVSFQCSTVFPARLVDDTNSFDLRLSSSAAVATALGGRQGLAPLVPFAVSAQKTELPTFCMADRKPERNWERGKHHA